MTVPRWRKYSAIAIGLVAIVALFGWGWLVDAHHLPMSSPWQLGLFFLLLLFFGLPAYLRLAYGRVFLNAASVTAEQGHGRCTCGAWQIPEVGLFVETSHPAPEGVSAIFICPVCGAHHAQAQKRPGVVGGHV